MQKNSEAAAPAKVIGGPYYRKITGRIERRCALHEATVSELRANGGTHMWQCSKGGSDCQTHWAFYEVCYQPDPRTQ